MYLFETAKAKRSIGDEHSAEHHKLLRELYSKFDPDGDGIGPDELQLIIEKINPTMPASVVKEMFEEADVDKSGNISFDEFEGAVSGAEAGENSSLTDGLAAVVIKTQVMKLQSDAIGRFFLIVFLCCKCYCCCCCCFVPIIAAVVIDAAAALLCVGSRAIPPLRSPAHEQDLRSLSLPENRPAGDHSDR